MPKHGASFGSGFSGRSRTDDFASTRVFRTKNGISCDLRFCHGVVCAWYAARARVASISGSMEFVRRGEDCLFVRGAVINSRSAVAGCYLAKLNACKPCASKCITASYGPDCPRPDVGWDGAAGSAAYASPCWRNLFHRTFERRRAAFRI